LVRMCSFRSLQDHGRVDPLADVELHLRTSPFNLLNCYYCGLRKLCTGLVPRAHGAFAGQARNAFSSHKLPVELPTIIRKRGEQRHRLVPDVRQNDETVRNPEGRQVLMERAVDRQHDVALAYYNAKP
jgi:hypothetical protein